MTRLTLYKITLFLSIVTGLTGIVLKILHVPADQILILLSLLFTLVYAIIGLSEIYKSDNITMDAKIMWTIGFIVLSTVTGLLYFLMGRKIIFRESNIQNQQLE